MIEDGNSYTLPWQEFGNQVVRYLNPESWYELWPLDTFYINRYNKMKEYTCPTHNLYKIMLLGLALQVSLVFFLCLDTNYTSKKQFRDS